MSPGYIVLFSIILLIILVVIGMKSHKEGIDISFVSTIDPAIDYTAIIQNITDISNNFIKDCTDNIKFTVNDPLGNFTSTSSNYSGMNTVGNYFYNYGQSISRNVPFTILPNISINYSSTFVVLYNDLSFNIANGLDGVNVSQTSSTFKSMVNLCTNIRTITQNINFAKVTTREQIHEYNMLVLTYAIFDNITSQFAQLCGLVNTSTNVSGQNLLDKYGLMSKHVINGAQQKMPAFLYYVLPYYENKTYNIPNLNKTDGVVGFNLDPDTLLKLSDVTQSLTSYCYYKPCLQLNQAPAAQVLSKIFNY